MTIDELREKLKVGVRVSINGEDYKILQHIIWWQAKSDANYDKYVLEDANGGSDFRFWISGEYLGISKIFHHDFSEPMPKGMDFEGKKYKLTQDEFCIVREVEGEEFYKVRDCEIWWDYVCEDDDGIGLSLGRDWESWKREDLKTTYIDMVNIVVKS